MKRRVRARQDILLKRAKKYLVGGVNSPVRAFNYARSKPVFIRNAKGSKIYDYNSKEYIDYVLSWGSLILGHQYKPVIKSVKDACASGLSFGLTNEKEVELAELISKAIPGVEKVRFVNSGTEALMSAVRLARAYTLREKIIIFQNSYHGHADYFLTSYGSGLATFSVSKSSGVPENFLTHTIVLPYGDKAFLGSVFKKYAGQIAAVLFEPVMANYGLRLPDESYLSYLSYLTNKDKVLLIADEVITGFRLGFGSYARSMSIDADIICLGKIIGGGLPIGAYGAREEIMRNISPLGKVYQASTFSGNPIVMQAGLATLKSLRELRGKYSILADLTGKLMRGIKEQAEKENIEINLSFIGSLFSIKFKKQEEFKNFYRFLLKEGVLFAPSEYETNFISFSHTEKDIKKTLKATEKAFNFLRRGIDE